MAQRMSYDSKGNATGKSYSGPNAPKADRSRRAAELRERMAATGKSVYERAAERGKTHIARPYNYLGVMRQSFASDGRILAMSADARKQYAIHVR